MQEKVLVCIDEDLLRKLDAYVITQKGRNRSAQIEEAVKQYLESKEAQ